jgi:hypothetical protein
MDKLNPSSLIPSDASPVDALSGAGDVITDEFTFHIEECARRLEREGLAPDAARAEAESRFGDPTTHYTQCRRQSTEARMNRVTKWVLAGTLVALVAAVCVLIFQVQRQDSLLRTMNDRMEVANGEIRRLSTSSQENKSLSAFHEPGVVYVDGIIKRPGVYALSNFELTLSRCVTAAGSTDSKRIVVHLIPGSDAELRINEWRSAGQRVVDSKTEKTYLKIQINQGESPLFDPVLSANDVLTVMSDGPELQQ